MRMIQHFNYLAAHSTWPKKLCPRNPMRRPACSPPYGDRPQPRAIAKRRKESRSGIPPTSIQELKKWEACGVDRVSFMMNAAEIIPQEQVLIACGCSPKKSCLPSLNLGPKPQQEEAANAALWQTRCANRRARAPVMTGFDTDAWELKGVEILNLSFEVVEGPAEFLVPRPCIPVSHRMPRLPWRGFRESGRPLHARPGPASSCVRVSAHAPICLVHTRIRRKQPTELRSRWGFIDRHRHGHPAITA